jgi:hypothetical protein
MTLDEQGRPIIHIEDPDARKERGRWVKLGIICTTPGNLRLYGTVWWASEDSNCAFTT